MAEVDNTDKLPYIRTEDGVEVTNGDKVYGFHSQMCVGTISGIGESRFDKRIDEYHSRLMQGSVQPWFYVDFDNGKRELLNGQRVASVEGAKAQGLIK